MRPARRGAGRLPLLLFSQELLALLEAGLSIVEALEALLEKNRARKSGKNRDTVNTRQGKNR